MRIRPTAGTPTSRAPARPWRRWVRQNAATELRREFGLEAASIILGHNISAITEIYAKKDEHEAVEAIMKVG
jgi:hypothetical protein